MVLQLDEIKIQAVAVDKESEKYLADAIAARLSKKIQDSGE